MTALRPDTLPAAVLEGIERHGNGFRAAREAAGLSVAELAERSDISVDRIEAFESGGIAPEPDEAGALAVALGVPSELFLE